MRIVVGPAKANALAHLRWGGQLAKSPELFLPRGRPGDQFKIVYHLTDRDPKFGARR